MTKLRQLVFCSAALLLAGCGGKESTPGTGDPGSPDNAPSAAGADPSTSPSSADPVPAGATAVSVTSVAYLPMPNGTCPVPTKYDLDLTNDTLSYSYCSEDDAGVPVPAQGTKVLSSDAAAPVITALHAMRVDSTISHCGDDNADTITFTASGGDTTLYSMFKHCTTDDTRTFVSGTYDLVGALYVAASKP